MNQIASSHPDPLFLSQGDFIKSFAQVPRVACNLFIVDRDDRFLLTKRGIEPERGKWHLPGSFLLKYESIAQCLERIASSELGFLVSSRDCRLKIVHENIGCDPRGHIIDVVYKYRLLKDVILKGWGDSLSMAFFTNSPPDMGFNHEQILKEILG
jgi:ADP-ribose pyrophosphatase YjhB (NUDIX family)